MKKSSKFCIAIFTHTQYKNNHPVNGPADTLVEYFKQKKLDSIYYLQHSLFRGNGSVCTTSTKTIFKYDFHQNFPNIVRYLIDIFYPLLLLKEINKCETIIAVDPLNFFTSFFLKKLKKARTVIYYTVDYAPQRFPSALLSWFYHALDQFAIKNCDLSFSSAQAIQQVRKKQGLRNSKNIYLPNTPLLYDLKPKSVSKLNRNNLVMVFSSIRGIDFPFLFKALSILIKDNQKLVLHLIGRGNFKTKVLKFVEDRKLLKHLRFYDTPTHKETLKVIRNCAIGLECNDGSSAWNEYREPLKIREYMSFGLPIVSKPGHALESEIEKNKFGFIVNTVEEFINAINQLTKDDKLYTDMRKKILSYIKSIQKKVVLDKIFFNKDNDLFKV